MVKNVKAGAVGPRPRPPRPGEHGLERDPILEEMVRRLVDRFAPERIYLFGSRARGDAQDESDYDLLVVVKERLGEGSSMEQEAYDALSGMGVAKDLVIMTGDYFDWIRGARASLPATVEREGRLLYAA